MKKLIFIDNDDERTMQDYLGTAKLQLQLNGGLSKEYVESMEIIPNYHEIWRDDKTYDMVFDKNNCICTWSLYSASKYNSLRQMLKTFQVAGQYNIKDIVYIDITGYLLDALYFDVKEAKYQIDILKAIENNYIITNGLVRNDFEGFKRVRINLKSDNIFETEDVNLLELLNN